MLACKWLAGGGVELKACIGGGIKTIIPDRHTAIITIGLEQ